MITNWFTVTGHKSSNLKGNYIQLINCHGTKAEGGHNDHGNRNLLIGFLFKKKRENDFCPFSDFDNLLLTF